MNKLYNVALHTLALTHTELRQFLFLASYYCSMCTVYLPLPQANILQGIIKVSSWRKISGEVGRRRSARRANPGESGGEFQTKTCRGGERERAREQGNGASDAALRSGYRPMLSLTGSEGNIPPSHQFILLTLQGGKFVNACLDVYVLHGQRKVLGLCQSLG